MMFNIPDLRTWLNLTCYTNISFQLDEQVLYLKKLIYKTRWSSVINPLIYKAFYHNTQG